MILSVSCVTGDHPWVPCVPGLPAPPPGSMSRVPGGLRRLLGRGVNRPSPFCRILFLSMRFFSATASPTSRSCPRRAPSCWHCRSKSRGVPADQSESSRCSHSQDGPQHPVLALQRLQLSLLLCPARAIAQSSSNRTLRMARCAACAPSPASSGTVAGHAGCRIAT